MKKILSTNKTDEKYTKEKLFHKSEMVLSIVCGCFLLLGFSVSFIPEFPFTFSFICYLIAYVTGGYYTTQEAIHGIRHKKFEIDFLMIVAASGAAALGEWAEGALLLFLFSMGHALEHYAMAKARKSIESLSGLAPKTALKIHNHSLQEVSIDELTIGDVILVKPNSKIAADGIIIKGQTSVNEAPITGESIPVDKIAISCAIENCVTEKVASNHKVFAGSINGSGNLEVFVTRIAADSTIARLVKLVNEAQSLKSPTQHFTDKVERFYVPAVLLLVVVLLFAFIVVDESFADSFYRAMSVLVGASPCALAISTPSAILSGVARAAWGGVLVKGGKPLEDLGSLTAIAFDKTGTLTEGKPKLTGIYPYAPFTKEQVLETVIAAEQLSDHPLAAAIVRDGIELLQKEVTPADNLQAIAGRGVKATIGEHDIYIGNKELLKESNILIDKSAHEKAVEMESVGNTTMLVSFNGRFMGIITIMDVARAEAKNTIAQLRKNGIKKIVMLTGDNQKVAESIAESIGINDAWGNLLPEEKLAAIDKLKSTEKKIAMVGDGVNDAPAMAKSTVGIAMGAAGSDVALETADVALMADKLSNLPFAIGLSRKTGIIIKQNLFISLGMVALLIPLTIAGTIKMGPAVIGHEGSTIVVVFNALRLLTYKHTN